MSETPAEIDLEELQARIERLEWTIVQIYEHDKAENTVAEIQFGLQAVDAQHSGYESIDDRIHRFRRWQQP